MYCATSGDDQLADAQGSWLENLSPTQVFTGQERPQALSVENNKRQKCHGNRKLQRFCRRCRARGLNEDDIAKLIDSTNAIKMDISQV
jgi:hypothetical protein